MKLTKYLFISFVFLMSISCQNEKSDSNNRDIIEPQTIKKEEVKIDSLSIITQDKATDTIAKIDSSITTKKEVNKINDKKEKKKKPILEEEFEPTPDEEYKLPKEMYFEVIKSKKFYDDSVAFYNWFMRSEHWKKEYGYPDKIDSIAYYKHYLHFWKDRVNTIKSQYDWSE